MSLSRDPYEVVLADLRAKRDEIDAAIRAIEAVRPPALSLGTPPPSEVFKQAESGQLRPFIGLSIEDGARAVLKRHGEPMGPNDLVSALKEGGLVMNSEIPANTVSSVLNRGWRNGSDVVRVSRGMWGLAEWFPNRDMRYISSLKDETEASDGKVAQSVAIEPLFE